MPFRLASSALNGGTNTVPASGRTGTLAPIPDTATTTPTGGTGSDSDSGGAFGRLADAFIAALGPQVSKKEDTTPYVVVDPNQGAQASGASVNFKTILIVAGLGVAGWWLWKKYGKAAVAN